MLLNPLAAPRVERVSWCMGLIGVGLAAASLVVFGVRTEPVTGALSGVMILLLCCAHYIYRVIRPDAIVANICGALAVLTGSAASAGIISLSGLRYGAELIDDKLAAIDGLLGLQTQSIVTTAAVPVWSQLLGAAYQSSFVLIFALVIFLALTQRIARLWQLVFVFAATIIACAVISVVLPARGAFAHFGYPQSVLDGLPEGSGLYHLAKFDYYRNSTAPAISFNNLQGVITFPSFHCCLALMTIFACRGIAWLFPVSLLWNALVLVSTIPIGGHYMIDVPGGGAIWLIATCIALELDNIAVKRTGRQLKPAAA